MIGNKIADKITSLDKTKCKEKEDERQENLHTTRKKGSRYWWLQIVLISYKNGIPKNHELISTKPDKVPWFITKKWIEVHDQLRYAKDRYKPSKQIRFKISMLR